MMYLSKEQIARMIDISAVKSDSSMEEVELVVKAAKKYQFICVFTLPSFAAYAKKLLAGETEIGLGGTVGFPSGASTTSSKAFEATELINFGCSELDMEN
jgi:deoxyribose-phosphate aldolase